MAFAMTILFAAPSSTRAYFKYVPPQPPAKRYEVVKTFTAVVTRYIKPKREYYASQEDFLDAIELNGEGDETFFGTKPQANFTLAANVNPKHGFKRGTIVKIQGKGINLIGEVDDRCAAAEKRWQRKKVVQLDVFSKMSQKQADAWGEREMTVEILQPI